MQTTVEATAADAQPVLILTQPETLTKMLTDRRTSPIYRPELLEQSGQKLSIVKENCKRNIPVKFGYRSISRGDDFLKCEQTDKHA